MKLKKGILIILLSVISLTQIRATEVSMDKVVVNALSFAESQSLKMAEKYYKEPQQLPRSFENGKMTTSDPKWWTSGFFPGTLWYLYENSKSETLLKYAKNYSNRIEEEKKTTDNHDIGFMLFCSFGNGYRIIGDSNYKNVILEGAKSLSTRFNPNIGLIRSWDFDKEIWQYPVIIDNMMNLEMLLWASQNSKNDNLKKMAISHANKTLINHYRTDISCYHVVSYDTISGKPHIKQTGQGFANESAWARGQSWGLYGFTMMYRFTHDSRYLEHAIKIAEFMINHSRMPKDMIPYWDFDAPNIPNAPRDASSAAIMASALIELSGYSNKTRSEKYLKIAEIQLRTLSSSEYTARLGENGDFILKHSVGNMPIKSEIDAPLTYADYYYVEALLRWKKKFGIQ